jgi:hypothetical protein
MADLGEFDALVGAMGEPGRGVVEISSGPRTVAEMEEIAARHGRRILGAPRWRSTTSSTRSGHQAVFTRHVDRPPHRSHPGQFGNRAAQQSRA